MPGRLVNGIGDGSLRYQGRVGEQLRGEVTPYQAALRDLVSTADKMLRLRLGDRMAAAPEISARATAQVAETEERLARRLRPGHEDGGHRRAAEIQLGDPRSDAAGDVRGNPAGCQKTPAHDRASRL